MKKRLAVWLVIFFTYSEPLLGLVASTGNPWAAAIAEAQEDSPGELFSPEQLENLLAPIALYPDPLLAQVLLSATFVDQVDEASRWMRAYNNPNAIDDQPWDVSVKAVAHYPSVLYMMSDQLDWTASLGQAYVYQSTDVMTSIQRLRALAYAAGNLVTNEEQQVIVRMPGGMEYKEFQVAQSVVLKGMGAVRFDYKNTHSSLADVDHTHKGLQA